LTDELIIDEEIIENIYKIFTLKGADAWYEMSIEELLPESKKDLAPNLEKVQEIMTQGNILQICILKEVTNTEVGFKVLF